MKWGHLPEDGGLYQQNPRILDRFYYIFAAKAQEEAKQAAKRNKESGPSGGSGLERQARSRR